MRENSSDGRDAVDPAALASLLAFWSDAGVDTALADDPVDRLAERRPKPVPAAAPAPVRAPGPAAVGAAALQTRVQAAGEAASSVADLAALATAAAAFFDLAQGPVVFGRGATDASVLVVGDAPTADDEAESQAFAGAAGRLLDRMLAAAGLGERAWLTHTVLQRPSAGTTSPEQVAVAAPFLERAADLLAPRAVLLLGDGPVRSLLGQGGGVLTLRGRWSEWRGLPVLATFPPGFLLRQPLAKRQAWQDVLTLAARLDRPDPGS